jgi:hypothetical protein
LCAGSLGCFDQAARRAAFDRALRGAVSVEALADLRENFVPPDPAARG